MTDSERPSGLVAVGKIQAPDAEAENRIVATFLDDNRIDGMRLEIMGTSPEQIAVLVFHLHRVANQLADASMLAAMKADAETQAIAASLRREKGRN